jgi:hypothetical protein
VLFAIAPLTIVDSTIPPVEDAIAFSFVVLKFAFVLFVILPHEFTDAVHFVLGPLPFVNLSIWP